MEFPISNVVDWNTRAPVTVLSRPVVTVDGQAQNIFVDPIREILTSTGRVYSRRNPIPLCNSAQEYEAVVADTANIIPWIVGRLAQRMVEDPPVPADIPPFSAPDTPMKPE